MTGLVLRWRVPTQALTLRWRGPAGALEAIAARPTAPLAGFIVPSAETAEAGIESRFNGQSLSP